MTTSLAFPRKLRLSHAREFEAVYAARLRKPRGPLILFAKPNSLPHHRLGLSIGRAVGSAVRRNRLKRHIREAFRLSRHDWPVHGGGAYDVVVGARKHDELELADYISLLAEGLRQLHKDSEKRAARRGPDPATGGGGAAPDADGGVSR